MAPELYRPSARASQSRRSKGNPNPKYIGTSYVERQNLNIRMGNRRMTRLTNAFSRKAENHNHMMAIYFMHYNFVRIHKTLKMTWPLASRPKLWEMADMVLEDWENSRETVPPNNLERAMSKPNNSGVLEESRKLFELLDWLAAPKRLPNDFIAGQWLHGDADTGGRSKKR